jgi:protocatechuate 3,4-dioxygenase alpha subunit
MVETAHNPVAFRPYAPGTQPAYDVPAYGSTQRRHPVTDAAVELWQADPPADESFPGLGRCRTDQRGAFRFTTVKPGPVPGRGNAQQAPHFAIALHARGLLKCLVTRAYFDGDPLNETDPLLSLIEDTRRRATLLAWAESADRWRLDIRLQRGPHGETETVFLDL